MINFTPGGLFTALTIDNCVDGETGAVIPDTALDGDCVLDLKPVNQILATVNHLLASDRGASPERVQLNSAILKRFGTGGAE